MERNGSFLVDEICEKVLTLADKVQVDALLSQCQRPRPAAGSHWHLREHAKAIPQALLRQRVVDAGGT
jgi:hypothetical protein